MSNYEHMLSPLTIRNKTLKNHLSASKFGPLYSDFEYDTEYYCRVAKNGAAIVTIPPGAYPSRELERLPDGSPTRFPNKCNLERPEDREQFARMISKIHECGSLVTVSLMELEPIYIGISSFDEYEEIMAKGEYVQTMNFRKPEATTEQLEKMTDEFAWRAGQYKELGADMVTIYMCYRSSILAQSLSPVLNRRTDKFGGKTMLERATLTKELFEKIRKVCGEDFLIEMQTSAEEDQPGYNSDDWVEYCKYVQDLVDIVQIRATGCSFEHANGINFVKGQEPPMLKFARKLKASGCTIKTAPVTGFNDVDQIEQYIADGDTDLVVMARRFLADSEFIKKVESGDVEDIIPCLRCNECHDMRPACSVNPLIANWTVYPDPVTKKKVAVIGGGIAGITAALTLEKRGHEVSLYEKSDRLGGQLNAAMVPDFKWPIRDYLAYMIKKVEASDIKLHLGEEVTPEQIKDGGFDAVVCALGSKAQTVPVPGADQDFIVLADDALLHEAELGHRIVVIGGADTGRETALHLAQKGHEVVMLTRQQARLWHDNHVQMEEERVFLETPGLSYIDHASVRSIDRNSLRVSVKRGIPKQVQGFRAAGPMGVGFVPCPDVPGSLPPENGEFLPGFRKRPYDESNMWIEEMEIPFDTLVISGGRKSYTEAAENFRSAAKEFYVIGDNIKPGDIKAANASAYDTAMRI